MENKKIVFTAENVEVIQDATSQFSKLKIKISRAGENLNHLPITENALTNASPTLLKKPILANVIKNGTAFGGHDPQEQPCGLLDEQFLENDEDNVTWQFAIGLLWKVYFPDIVDIFSKAKDNSVSVSMEINVLEKSENDLGEMVIEKFEYAGVTLIGVQAAIPDASATMIEFSKAVEEYEINKFSNVTNFPSKGQNKPVVLENSNYPEFDFDYAMDLRTSYPSIWNRGGLSHSEKHFSAWMDAHSGKSNSDIENWVRGRERYAEKHSKERTISGNMGLVKRGITSDFGIETMKVLLDTEKRAEDKKKVKYFVGGEKMADGKTLKVDKSKDKVSSTPWGEVDKTELEHKVTEAANAGSLVHDVYLVVDDGWEKAPSESLHFPVMQLVGDTFVYNKGGLSSALGRAKGENMDALASKIVGIQKKLGLEGGEDANKKDNKDFEKEVTETMADKEKEVKEKEAEKEAKETPEEEKAESPAEEAKEKAEGTEKEPEPKEKMAAKEDDGADAEPDDDPDDEKFCLGDNEFSALMSAMGEDGKDFAEEAKKAPVDYKKFVKAMAAKMCKMAEENAKLKSDNDAYMAKMAAEEKKQFSIEVESLLHEVADVLPKDEIDAAREDAGNFKFSEIDGWKNKVKAKAFTFTKKGGKKDNEVRKFATVWAIETPKKVNSLWD